MDEVFFKGEVIMSEVSYEIKGKSYREDDVIAIYEYWRTNLDCEDITDAINHVIDYNKVLSAFVKKNVDMIKEVCIEHLNHWHEMQSSSLSTWEESIFDFSLQLIDCIYYEATGQLP